MSKKPQYSEVRYMYLYVYYMYEKNAWKLVQYMYRCKYFHAIQKLQNVFPLLGWVHWEVLGILERSPILVLSLFSGPL